MKKNSLLNKTLVFIVAVSIISIMFTGCGNNNQSVSTNSNSGSNSSNSGGFNSDEIKNQMQSNIASLVSDGTINQSQADKIVTALTANTQRFNGQRRGFNNQSNGHQNNDLPNGQQSNNQNNYQGSRPNGQRMNPLSQLVSDGVITQAQADAVMQKIRGNFRRPQGNTSNTSSNS